MSAPVVMPRPRRVANLPPWPEEPIPEQSPLVLCRDEPYPTSKLERILGRWHGHNRFGSSRDAGWLPFVESDLDATRSNDQGGGITEIAFAVRTGIMPSFNYSACTIWNFRLWSGARLALNHDVPGWLLLDVARHNAHVEHKKERPDLWVVLKGELPWLFFAGWATDAELLATKPRVICPPYGPAYCLTEAELHPRLEILVPAKPGFR